MVAHVLSDAEVTQVRAMILAGWTSGRIARTMGVSRPVIDRIRHHQTYAGELDFATRLEMTTMYDMGASVRLLAVLFEVDPSTVRRAVSRGYREVGWSRHG